MVSKGVFPGSLVKDKQALDLPLIYCLCYSKKNGLALFKLGNEGFREFKIDQIWLGDLSIHCFVLQ